MKLLIAFIAFSGIAWASDAWIGVLLSDNGATHGGTRVREVMHGSPGEKAGIAAGDEVLSVDDHKTQSSQALIQEVRAAGAGKSVKVKLVDPKGKPRTVTVKLLPRPSMDELQKAELVGRPAPDFEPAIVAGARLSKISELRGKVVLIDFFATWCGPCVLAMPHLEEMHQKLASKGLTVLGISTESSNIVAGAAAKFKLSYSLASDENEGVSGSYRVFALPTMILIDKKGVVREVSVNDPDLIDAAVEKALK
jgi:peroxiredoxin